MRTLCRACEGDDFKRVLNLGNLPLAGGFLEAQRPPRMSRRILWQYMRVRGAPWFKCSIP